MPLSTPQRFARLGVPYHAIGDAQGDRGGPRRTPQTAASLLVQSSSRLTDREQSEMMIASCLSQIVVDSQSMGSLSLTRTRWQPPLPVQR
jgi:hypothetical protein